VYVPSGFGKMVSKMEMIQGQRTWTYLPKSESG
jgi:hypothetical protein